jgi:hypothetical protein
MHDPVCEGIDRRGNEQGPGLQNDGVHEKCCTQRREERQDALLLGDRSRPATTRARCCPCFLERRVSLLFPIHLTSAGLP